MLHTTAAGGDQGELQGRIFAAHPTWTAEQVADAAHTITEGQGGTVDLTDPNLATEITNVTPETVSFEPDLSGYYISSEGNLTNGTSTYNRNIHGWYIAPNDYDLAGDYTTPTGDHKVYFIDEKNGGLQGVGQRFVLENSRYDWSPNNIDNFMREYIADHPEPFNPGSPEFRSAVLRAPEPDFVVRLDTDFQPITVPGYSSGAVEHGNGGIWYAYAESAEHNAVGGYTRYDAEPIGVRADNGTWYLRQNNTGGYFANIGGEDKPVTVNFIASKDHGNWSAIAETTDGKHYELLNGGWNELNIDLTKNTFELNPNQLAGLTDLLATEYGLNPDAALAELFKANADNLLSSGSLDTATTQLVNDLRAALDSGLGFTDKLVSLNSSVVRDTDIRGGLSNLFLNLNGVTLNLPKIVR